MRIQETDRILKDSKVARHTAAHEHDHDGVISRLWKKVTSVFKKD
jgi:hypothetical protein